MLGITRIANITHLDRIGLPVFSATVPDSCDLLSVYSGRGLTKEQAKRGAIMEAFERFAASLPLVADYFGSWVMIEPNRRVDLQQINLGLRQSDWRHAAVRYLEGYSLKDRRVVNLPICLVGYSPLEPFEPALFSVTTTNGLAAGTSHSDCCERALLEVLERDAWSIMDYLVQKAANFVQSLGSKSEQMANRVNDQLFCVLDRRFPAIDLISLPKTSRGIVTQIESEGITVIIRDIANDVDLPIVMAILIDFSGDLGSGSHVGFAASFDQEQAIVAAITEAAQSRAVDFQGVREDLAEPGGRGSATRVSIRNPLNWYHKQPRDCVSFTSLEKSRVLSFQELVYLVSEKIGEPIVVDLSPKGFSPYVLVRAVVPGAESWAIDRSKAGYRCSCEWKKLIEEMPAISRLLILSRIRRRASHS